MKRGTYAYTKGHPAVGGMPAVQPELVKVMRREQNVTSVPGDEWYVVRFADGGRMTMHASNLRPGFARGVLPCESVGDTK